MDEASQTGKKFFPVAIGSKKCLPETLSHKEFFNIGLVHTGRVVIV